VNFILFVFEIYDLSNYDDESEVMFEVLTFGEVKLNGMTFDKTRS